MFKLKVKVKILREGVELPKIIKKGDWIDLSAAEIIEFSGPKANALRRKNTKNGEDRFRKVEFEPITYIPLGIAAKLPKGFEAIVVSRSSTPKRHGIMCANAFGVIDNSYCGNKDEWCFPALPIRKTLIDKSSRIAQFRIQLSQKATFLQKLKWFFTNGIEIIEVNNLSDTNRGGLGSTGV